MVREKRVRGTNGGVKKTVMGGRLDSKMLKSVRNGNLTVDALANLMKELEDKKGEGSLMESEKINGITREYVKVHPLDAVNRQTEAESKDGEVDLEARGETPEVSAKTPLVERKCVSEQ